MPCNTVTIASRNSSHDDDGEGVSFPSGVVAKVKIINIKRSEDNLSGGGTHGEGGGWDWDIFYM